MFGGGLDDLAVEGQVDEERVGVAVDGGDGIEAEFARGFIIGQDIGAGLQLADGRLPLRRGDRRLLAETAILAGDGSGRRRPLTR